MGLKTPTGMIARIPVIIPAGHVLAPEPHDPDACITHARHFRRCCHSPGPVPRSLDGQLRHGRRRQRRPADHPRRGPGQPAQPRPVQGRVCVRRLVPRRHRLRLHPARHQQHHPHRPMDQGRHPALGHQPHPRARSRRRQSHPHPASTARHQIQPGQPRLHAFRGHRIRRQPVHLGIQPVWGAGA